MSKKLGQMIDRNPHVKVRTEEGDRPLNKTAFYYATILLNWNKYAVSFDISKDKNQIKIILTF